MARLTVEDCLHTIPNRFELTVLAAKRARQLALGRAEPLVPWDNDKPAVVALREIAAGVIDAAEIDRIENEPMTREAMQAAFATEESSLITE